MVFRAHMKHTNKQAIAMPRKDYTRRRHSSVIQFNTEHNWELATLMGSEGQFFIVRKTQENFDQVCIVIQYVTRGDT